MRNLLLLILLGSGISWMLVGCESEEESHPKDAVVSENAAEQIPADDYVSRRFLREVAEVVDMMATEPNLLIIEVSKPDEYAKGHIEGAFNVWRPEYANEVDYSYGGMMATRKQMEALLSEMGATSESFILLYDARGCVDAARFQWILHEYNHSRTALINGGKHAWTLEGHLLTREAPEKIPSQFVFSPASDASSGHYIQLQEVMDLLGDPNVVLLDTRSEEEYMGAIHKKGAAKPGRIPGAMNIDWGKAINYDGDFCFRPVQNLRRMYEYFGVTPDKKIIVYCHSGVRSAHTTFVLTELLGYPEVYNYDGSWIEWSYHDEFPCERDEPQTISAVF